MAESALKRLYDRSPRLIQEAVLNGYALRIHLQRYGSRFERVRRLLADTEWFGQDQIGDFQDEHIRRLVRHAYRSVPYYRRRFDEWGIRPDDIKGRNDLRRLPMLTREDVRDHPSELISERVRPRRLVPGHTSGTTGSPLSFYWDINTCVYTNALDWRQKRWAGVDVGEPIALILGRMIVPTRTRRPPFWRRDYLHNQLWMSAFHMSAENLCHYVTALKHFRPVAMEGYPSTLFILARYLVARGESLPVRAAFTSSETLLPVQRETIERAFSCRVFDFYGLAERVLFATECEAHSGKHLNFELGFTEIVGGDGHPVANGSPGVVVSTSLQNFGMPFIRYRTSDVSAIRPAGACACGREMPRLEDITTKAEDIVVTPDGRLISPSVLTHPFKPLDRIEASQIIQEAPDRLRVLVVRREGYRDADTASLVFGLQERVGPEMRIDVEFIEELGRTGGGKFRWVISRVPLAI